MNTTTLLQDAPTTAEDSTTTAAPSSSLHPVVAFVIGLAIILGASLMNAGGLNLTKLDHSRQSIIPKSSRRPDWLRPLWLLGMLLYALSQLVGSTLALEFMRAEYVAPLGSTSLIFNFLFASVLIGTPVTSTDVYGTVIIVFGVIGIVLFGSINSGLSNDMDITRLNRLWGRAGWLSFFILMTIVLFILYICVSQLDAVLVARADISSVPFSGENGSRQPARPKSGPASYVFALGTKYKAIVTWVYDKLEQWTSAHSDKQIAWTLGIGWACCGGGLAGGCLVFAKVCVKLISGSLSHQNTGNQFGHFTAILTFILLAVTAIFQIICLNRGLRVYDSTLVVPVFYGVYTASGFLNSLIFNDQVDAYQTWDLFLIFLSIVVLIGGVVLLTNKKPEKPQQSQSTQLSNLPQRSRRSKKNLGADGEEEEEEEEDGEEAGLHRPEPGEEEVLWQLGDDSDEEEGSAHQTAPARNMDEGRSQPRRRESHKYVPSSTSISAEHAGLIHQGDDEHDGGGGGDGEEGSGSSGSSLTHVEETFGDWKTAPSPIRTR
ncbi:hypothetical protein Clacol_000760 [Clathrus columnatus]|uniref:Uncharacterized protein n=1 Tax=Clathrus columnatus TaxID=1419009 RepID=A0AAV4ZZI4_9AGAM|nr:hypothetical protein Clacol_000760 [Clathrus columnatus]